ncbi:MAG: hypothetical protein ACSLE1_03015 [Sphingobium sp.]
MKMIEQAARAVAQEITNACAATGGSCNGTVDGRLSVNATFDPAQVVRAVLAVIRVPSEEMEDAGRHEGFLEGWGDSPNWVAGYQAMIDAMLDDG